MSAPIDLAQIPDLVDRYAPIVYFNSDEKYFLSPIEDYIAACEEQPGTTDYPGLGLKLKSRGLVLPGHDQPVINGDLDGDVLSFVNVKLAADVTDIQYWFFYAYNGPGTAYLKRPPIPLKFETRWQSLGDHSLEPCGQHEGDWEHITVRVANESGEASQVYLSQHGDGQWCDVADVSDASGRIRFYASKYGHAAYPTPDRHYTEERSFGIIEFRLLNDTSTPDRSFDTQGRTAIIGLHCDGQDIGSEAAYVEHPDWMKYDGRWGEVLLSRDVSAIEDDIVPGIPISIADVMKKLGIYSECEQEAGPLAPWSKSNWAGAE